MALTLSAGLAACGATAHRMTLGDIPPSREEPRAYPESRTTEPDLVVYPGLEVSYVANGDGEIYHLHNTYYCFFDGKWFSAHRVDGPWRHQQMKYVPSDLFRVRGQLPPGVSRANEQKPTLILR